MATEDWFDDFALTVRDRFPRVDFPASDDRYWPGLSRTMFITHAATEEVARQCLRKVRYDGTDRHELSRAIIAVLADHQTKQNEAQREGPVIDTSSRDAARLASRDCPDCGAEGLTLRFRHKSVAEHSSPIIVCYCTCAMGRWVKSRHDADTQRRIYDLEDYDWLQLRDIDGVGWDNPYRYPVELWQRMVSGGVNAEEAERIRRQLLEPAGVFKQAEAF